MTRRFSTFSVVVFAVSVGSALSVATLIWLGYRSATNWKKSAALAAQHSTEIANDLLFTTLTRDMRAVQSNVLLSLTGATGATPPVDNLHIVVSAFARYPY